MKRPLRIHSRGLFAAVIDQIRGLDQMLIRAGDELPLVVASYPRGRLGFATSLQSALCSTYPSLTRRLRDSYRDVLEKVPTLVVAELRPRNACTCLGHRHLPGTESRLARRLMSDTGRRVGEMDLAVEAIRSWEPLPLSGLAVSADEYERDEASLAELEYRRFHTALLAVFLHELEHLAYPKREESLIRRRSNELYAAAMRDYVASQFGVAYGI